MIKKNFLLFLSTTLLIFLTSGVAYSGDPGLNAPPLQTLTPDLPVIKDGVTIGECTARGGMPCGSGCYR